eukprot:1188685-Rhodomonas_salina.7
MHTALPFGIVHVHCTWLWNTLSYNPARTCSGRTHCNPAPQTRRRSLRTTNYHSHFHWHCRSRTNEYEKPGTLSEQFSPVHPGRQKHCPSPRHRPCPLHLAKVHVELQPAPNVFLSHAMQSGPPNPSLQSEEDELPDELPDKVPDDENVKMLPPLLHMLEADVLK